MVTRTYCPKQLKDPQTKHQFTRGHENFCDPKQLNQHDTMMSKLSRDKTQGDSKPHPRQMRKRRKTLVIRQDTTRNITDESLKTNCRHCQ